MSRPPLVGLPTDRKMIGAHPFLAVGEKYLRAVVDGADCLPMLIPGLQPPLALHHLLEGLDGLLLTGAVSNIEPHHYSDEPSYAGNVHDPARDATNLALVPMAIEMDLPVLAICRGFQEVNVACGGALHQKVHDVPGMMDHREDTTAPLDVQYGPAHAIHLAPGGILASITGADHAQVNSVHGQGVARLGHRLAVEATAPDGLVEAFRHVDCSFVLAVQWHPEWKPLETPFYHAIFRAFGDACRRRAQRRNG